ncbi:MAG: metallophosphoesterase [Clostridia bacterium]|nr:metallophosphoesterase [Clostridia bacterium]
MALYVIGDTHFSEGCNKPMDIFGGAWTGYRDKLISSLSVLQPEDVLVLAGDFSWGMSLQEALPDFRLLDSFPGKKLLIKGNHDYWWETVSKMKRFFAENTIETIDFLHNSCYFYNGAALCGTRGWFYDKNDPAAGDDKIFKRELLRLEASLKAAVDQGAQEIDCFLHYPPVFAGTEVPQITEILSRYPVKRVFYGHLHGDSLRGAFSGMRNGIYYAVVSADALGFKPIQIRE